MLDHLKTSFQLFCMVVAARLARFAGLNICSIYAPNGENGEVLAVHFAKDERTLYRAARTYADAEDQAYLDRAKGGRA